MGITNFVAGRALCRGMLSVLAFRCTTFDSGVKSLAMLSRFLKERKEKKEKEIQQHSQHSSILGCLEDSFHKIPFSYKQLSTSCQPSIFFI